MKENFIKNFKAIEKAMCESASLDRIKSSGFSNAELASIYAKIIEIAAQNSLNLEELKMKDKSQALDLEKIHADIELSILKAKADIRVAEAEATKNIVQCISMIRSVGDNAAINQANAYNGFLNIVGNATEGAAIAQYAPNVINVIKKIDTTPITEFDDTIKALIENKSDFGSKSIIIHAPKTLLGLGEFVELKGISTYGQNKTRWKINDELMASDTKNYLFEARKVGEFKVSFSAQDTKGEFVKDEVILKVIEGEVSKEKAFIKKF